jgi:hypothetical protein
MRLRLLLLLGLPLVGGGLGYGAGGLLKAQAGSKKPAAEAPQPVKLGQFAVDIYHVRQISTLVANVELQVKDAATAARLSGAAGRDRLRDRAYRLLFDAAETPLFLAGHVPPERIAALLKTGLAPRTPGIDSVKILSAVSSDRPRS